MKKYKYDFIIIIVIALIAIISIIILNVTSKTDNVKALVYHNDALILEIPLDSETEEEYIVTGDVSSIVILASIKGIRIKESDCVNQDCVHQGLINNTNQTITCLPNKISIRIVGEGGVDIVI